MESSYSLASQVEVKELPRPGLFLKTTFSLYRSRFLRWFSITAPTSLVAAVFLILVDRRIREIFQSFPMREIGNHLADVVAADALRFGGFYLSWLLGCFALGAIATVVSDLDREDSEVAWRPDSHQKTREHFGSIAATALITFCAFLVGVVLLEIAVAAASRIVGWRHLSLYVISLVGIVAVASIVSWLGMAVPLIVRGKVKFKAALKKSMELSNGYEGALFLLVVESVAGPSVAWYVVQYGLWFISPDSLRYSGWYGWLVSVVAVLASAALEPPLLIGFSLLADPELLKAASLSDSQQPL